MRATLFRLADEEHWLLLTLHHIVGDGWSLGILEDELAGWYTALVDDVQVPVLVWHGERDRSVPIAHGRRLAAMLPHCHATFVPEAGHYLVFDHWAQILSAVAAAAEL